MVYLWASLLWLVMLGCAIALGALRQFVLVPALGDTPGRAVGTLLLCAIFAALIALFVRLLHVQAPATLWALGLLWSLTTIAFELFMGRVLMKLPWSEILADYNILAGRLWILVPLTLLLAPILTAKRL